MSRQQYRIIPGTESDIHDEPHISGSRMTVRHVHARVEGRGLRPETVAQQHNVDVGEVYDALAYYHRNQEEMQAVETRHERAAAAAAERSPTPEE